jgi:hypothetical protein
VSDPGVPPRPEPAHLRHGREHDSEQKEAWRRDGLDIEFVERPGLEKYRSGRRGYTDIRGRIGPGNDGLIVEIKSDDLDRPREATLRRRIARYIAQIEDYMYSPSHDYDTIQACVQFERRPASDERMRWIEGAFNDHGISCVWLDE